jgi:hypothetical protein
MIRLDIDRGRPLPALHRMAVLLDRVGYRMGYVLQRRSHSGKGWHLEVQVSPEPGSAVETVALQAILGSDPGREAFNLRRARLVDQGKVSRYWRQRWNVFYA